MRAKRSTLIVGAFLLLVAMWIPVVLLLLDEDPPQPAPAAPARDAPTVAERDAAPPAAREPVTDAYPVAARDGARAHAALPERDGNGDRGEPTPMPVETTRFGFDRNDAFKSWAARGKWEYYRGRAISSADEEGRSGQLTLRTYFAEIERLTIRGGIRLPSQHNLRVQAGSVTLIFNWEVADENHYYMGPRNTRSGPSALVPGQEHTIVLEQVDDFVHLSVDGRQLWRAEGRLHGPVTVYGAGSELEIREVLVRGRAVPGVEVKGPAYPPH